MRECDPRFRDQLLQVRRDVDNIVDTVMDKIYLPLSRQLAEDGLAHHLVIVLHDISLYGNAAFRRLLQHSHVPDPDKAHVQCPGDRCRGQCQHVHVFLHLLDLLLVADAEALLFIHHKKTQIFEPDVLGQQPVRADHDVAEPLGDLLDGLFLLRRRPESGEHSDRDGESVHSLAEGVVVLLRQYSCGHQYRHLLAFLYRLEGGPHGDLCFAVSDVSADQPVHDAVAFHVPLGVFDRGQLVLGLLIRKHLFKLSLPDRVGTEAVALLLAPRRIELHQVVGDLRHRFFDPALGSVPFLRSELVQLGFRGSRGSVFLEHGELCGQHIKGAPPAVLYFDIVLGDVVDLDLLDAAVDADPVVLVDDIVARFKLGEGLDLLAVVLFLLRLLFLLGAEDIRFRNDRESDRGVFESAADPAVISHDLARL